MLKQSLELYDLYVLKIAVCDQRIEQHLKTMTSKPEPVPTSDPAALPRPSKRRVSASKTTSAALQEST